MLERIISIISDCLNANSSLITEKTNLYRDLDIDSLSIIKIIVSLENEFNISIDDEAIGTFINIHDIEEYITGHIKKSNIF